MPLDINTLITLYAKEFSEEIVSTYMDCVKNTITLGEFEKEIWGEISLNFISKIKNGPLPIELTEAAETKLLALIISQIAAINALTSSNQYINLINERHENFSNGKDEIDFSNN